jgi:hypothetical protein
MLQESTPKASYVAFSDQDDIWHLDKLEKGIRALAAKEDGDCPAPYCTRQFLVDASGQPIGLSPDYRRPPSFNNALVENIETGCTMIVNQPVVELVKSLPLPDVVFHDWWLYLLVTGVGGKVVFDPEPGIDYRQHGKNLVGSTASPVKKQMNRYKKLVARESRIVLQKKTWPHSKKSVICRMRTITRFFLSCLIVRKRGWRRVFLCQKFTGLPVYRQSKVDTTISRILFYCGIL